MAEKSSSLWKSRKQDLRPAVWTPNYLQDLEDREHLVVQNDVVFIEKDALIETAISMFVAVGPSKKDARAKLLG